MKKTSKSIVDDIVSGFDIEYTLPVSGKTVSVSKLSVADSRKLSNAENKFKTHLDILHSKIGFDISEYSYTDFIALYIFISMRSTGNDFITAKIKFDEEDGVSESLGNYKIDLNDFDYGEEIPKGEGMEMILDFKDIIKDSKLKMKFKIPTSMDMIKIADTMDKQFKGKEEMSPGEKYEKYLPLFTKAYVDWAEFKGERLSEEVILETLEKIGMDVLKYITDNAIKKLRVPKLKSDIWATTTDETGKEVNKVMMFKKGEVLSFSFFFDL